MKKITLIFLALLTTAGLYANMASPIREGALIATAFSSQNMDILKETLVITPDASFRSARFDITYHIRTDSAGRLIPLLFHAKDYLEDFRVWVDGQEVTVQPVPEHYTQPAQSPFEGFSPAFRYDSLLGTEAVYISWYQGMSQPYRLYDLQYFETDLSAGEHTIRVSYIGLAWENRSDWVKVFSLKYSLSPARHWRSFGTVQITVEAPGLNGSLTTNLGQPNEGTLPGTAKWTFDKLPADYVEITMQPAINSLASTLLAIGPKGLTAALALLLVALHLTGMYRFRRRKPQVKISWVMLTGGIIIPLLVLLGYMQTFGWIDAAIGPNASKYHGYTFLVLIFYPIAIPVYLGCVLLADVWMKRRMRKRGQG